MKRYVAALALPLALASCGGNVPTADIAQCGAALMAARATNGSADLLMAAQQVPACRALALDVMQGVVAQVMQRRGIK